MSCPYYWWDNHYACRKMGKDVNEDTYYKYCRDYDYSDCPVYKGQDSSGCFLTSACCEAKQLEDDCYQLSTLRKFRDGYLKAQPCGECEINEYYFIAPQIVSAIKQREDSNSIFNAIYENMVLPCIHFIENDKPEEAHSLYRSYTMKLKNEFLG